MEEVNKIEYPQSSSSFSLFTNINPSLLVPVIILFLLLRLKSICNISLRIISGLKLFTKKMYHSTPQPPIDPSEPLTPSEIIGRAIAKLQLTMIEIEDSTQCLHLLKFQLFYDIYDILIYLSLSSFLGYLWSMGYYCYIPEVQISCWVVILILSLIMFSLQALVNIVYLTGFDKKESKIALLTSAIVFILSFLLFWIDCSYVDKQTVQDIAIHINALLLQIDHHIHGIPFHTLVPLVYTALSLLLALIALGLVIPAIRFASLLLVILTGPGASLVSWKMKTLLLVDIAMPLLVAIIYSSLPSILYDITIAYTHTTLSTTTVMNENCDSNVLVSSRNSEAGTTCTDISVDGVCITNSTTTTSYYDSNTTITNSTTTSYYDSNRESFTQSLFIVQYMVVITMVAVRLLCMKKHLQCHLDSLVSAVSAQIISPNVSEDSISLLQQKACTGYLMAASTQYLAIPVFAIACLLLFHISSPTGSGLCYGIYYFTNSNMTTIVSSIDHLKALNTSAIAIAKADQPYITDIFFALAGMKMKGYTDDIGLDRFYDFSLKISEIYALPHAAAISLSKSLLCFHSLLWFVLYVLAIYVWKYHPNFLLAKALTTNNTDNTNTTTMNTTTTNTNK